MKFNELISEARTDIPFKAYQVFKKQIKAVLAENKLSIHSEKLWRNSYGQQAWEMYIEKGINVAKLSIEIPSPYKYSNEMKFDELHSDPKIKKKLQQKVEAERTVEKEVDRMKVYVSKLDYSTPGGPTLKNIRGMTFNQFKEQVNQIFD